MELKSTTDIISLGYRDLSIVDRHLKKNGEVIVMVKIQIIQCESEKHSLSQDMARLLRHPRSADTKLTCGGINNAEISVHSSVIAARSPILAEMITPLSKESEVEVKETYEIENREEKKKEESEGPEQNNTCKEVRVTRALESILQLPNSSVR